MEKDAIFGGYRAVRPFFLFLLMAFLSAGQALAQGASPVPESPTCDPDFDSVMKARAWMGGQRDMEAAQTLIKGAKSGGYSVLELICFNSRAVGGGFDAGSGNAYIGRLVSPVTSAYLNANFSGSLCTRMSELWHTAKCENIDKARFYTLKEMIKANPRGCPAPDTKRWQASYDLLHVPYKDKQIGIDQTETFLKILTAKGGCGAFPPIPTNIKVMGDTGSYDDAICRAPGCYYSGKTNICTK